MTCMWKLADSVLWPVQDALQEKLQETLSLEPLIQSIAKTIEVHGGQPIPLEELHRDIRPQDNDTGADCGSLQVTNDCLSLHHDMLEETNNNWSDHRLRLCARAVQGICRPLAGDAIMSSVKAC